MSGFSLALNYFPNFTLWEKLKTRSTTSPLLNGPSAAGLVSLPLDTGPDIATTTEVVKWLGKQKPGLEIW